MLYIFKSIEAMDQTTLIILSVFAIIILVYLLLPKADKIKVRSNKSYILFYRPSCPACVAFKPTWEKITQMINAECVSYNTEDPNTTTLIEQGGFDVPTIPTIYEVTERGKTKYEGLRTLEHIKNWAERS